MSAQVCKFVWYELTTSDLDAAQSFYQKVIGWTISDAGMAAYRYSILSAGAVGIGGMMAINDEMKARGVPPCWTGYVGVPDVDAMVARFVSAGGAVHLAPADIPAVGRFALVTDPFGAALILFTPQAGAAPAPVAPGTPGHVGWHELMTRNAGAAVDFYGKTLGWTSSRTHDMGPMGLYHLFASGGEQDVGGVMNLPPEMTMPCWSYYINVDSTAAVLKRVGEAGGKVLNGPMQVPTGHWVAQCQDPQGAYFSVVGPA
jgi:uncharacterized protein